MSHDESTAPRDFVREIVTADVAAGKYGGRVVTRFPPEPNGYLHIGHAKSMCLNFGIAEEFDGVCNLRFDDTNPTTEDPEFVAAIQRDVRWLGFDWGATHFYASDYFERLYELAEKLIRDGKAYVDDASEAVVRENRGTVMKPGWPTPSRSRSADESLDLFRRMRAGEFPDGSHVLRARIDLAAPNMLMRDPILYRIRHQRHYRTGDRWCIYPMYDFTHCLSDAFEGVTHSLCTLEFENNRALYDWVVEETEVPHVPRQYEFARLNLSYTVMSKRKLLRLVTEGHVAGWDDPRMPTLSGLRRRGYTPQAIRAFCDRVGVAKTFNVIDVALLEYSIRDDLNRRWPRALAVLRPLKLVVESWPEGKVEELTAPDFPPDVPGDGERKVPFTRELYIERDDFMEDPSPGYRRLAPGREVRLRYAYVVRLTDVVRDAAGELVELRCVHDPRSRGGRTADGRKVPGTIHWVSAERSEAAEVRIYDRLFDIERPDAAGDEFVRNLNPRSLEVLAEARVEPSLADAAVGDGFQFERQGYFVVDAVDSTPGHLVFNRTVTLRDTWAKVSHGERAEEEKRLAAERAKAKAAAKEQQRQISGGRTERQLSTEEQRLAEEYRVSHGLTVDDAELLAAEPALASFFAEGLAADGGPRALANWIVNDVQRELKEREDLPFGGTELAELSSLVASGAISATAARTVFAELVANGGQPAEIVAEQNLGRLSGGDELTSLIEGVLGDHPDQVAQYRAGKTALLGFFVGQAMRLSGGRADAQQVGELLRDRLD